MATNKEYGPIDLFLSIWISQPRFESLYRELQHKLDQKRSIAKDIYKFAQHVINGKTGPQHREEG